MKIFNLYNHQLLIKHETAIDPDCMVIFEKDEMIDFHYYFTNLVNNGIIAVQVFEYANRDIKLSDYSYPEPQWESNEGVEAWREKFKANHQMQLYFYAPDKRRQNVYNGYVDTSSRLFYSDNNQLCECFEIIEYLPYEFPASSTFQVEIYAEQIYQCLEKSTIPECQLILADFQKQQLKKRLDDELSNSSKNIKSAKI